MNDPCEAMAISEMGVRAQKGLAERSRLLLEQVARLRSEDHFAQRWEEIERRDW